LSFLPPILSGKGLPRVTGILRKHYESPEGLFFLKKEVFAAQLALASWLLSQEAREGPESSRWAQIREFLFTLLS